MKNQLKRLNNFMLQDGGNVAIVMAFLFPFILLLGALAVAGTNYQSLASQVKAAAQSVATFGGVSNPTPANLSAFCTAVQTNNSKITSCVPTQGSLMGDNSFCEGACNGATTSAVQVKVCGSLVNFSGKTLGSACSTAVVAGNKISAVTTGITGEGGLIPIAINGCIFNNGGPQNSNKGYTYWDDDNHKPFTSYTSKRIYLSWGHGDDDGVSGNYDYDGTGGRYQSGNDKQGKAYHFCSNTGNFLDFTGAGSTGSPSSIFSALINSRSSTSSDFSDGTRTTLRSVDLSTTSIGGRPTWLGSSMTLNIGDKVPALGGMAENASWYSMLNLTNGGTYLFPVVTSYPNSLSWGQQALLTVTAFAPMTVNKVCYGSLATTGYIASNGVEYSGYNSSTKRFTNPTGCDYGSQPYKIPNGYSGGLSDKYVWLPYIDVGFKTGYKARNTTHKKVNGEEGRNYGADGAIKRYRNDETRE